MEHDEHYARRATQVPSGDLAQGMSRRRSDIELSQVVVSALPAPSSVGCHLRTGRD